MTPFVPPPFTCIRVAAKPGEPWCTAAYKAYPVQISRAIAQAFVQQIAESLTPDAQQEFVDLGDQPVPDEVASLFLPADGYQPCA